MNNMYGILYDRDTAEAIRAATLDELVRSLKTGTDERIFSEVEGDDNSRAVYIIGESSAGRIEAEALVDGSEPQAMGPLGPIRHSLDLVGMVESGTPSEPETAVQYVVLTPTGQRMIFGDQEWVRSGQVLEDFAPNSTVQKRAITISYGEWEDA
jgi:hypothetical protein